MRGRQSEVMVDAEWDAGCRATAVGLWANITQQRLTVLVTVDSGGVIQAWILEIDQWILSWMGYRCWDLCSR